MVKRVEFFGFILGLLLPLFAWGDGSSCGEFQPCEKPLHLGVIKSVRIQHDAQAVPGMAEAGVDCNAFRLTPAQVRKYLSHAGRITGNDRQYIVSDSPCNATGEVVYSSGKRATWTIGMLKEGRLTFTKPDGSSEIIDLYCSRCTFSPFVD